MSNREENSEVLNQIYHALRAQRRRHLIRLLAEADEKHLTVRACAKQIAAMEEGIKPEKATGEKYRNVYNAMSQTHLPTLSDADLIRYNSNRQIISKGPNLQLAVLIININQETCRAIQRDDNKLS